MIDGGLLSCALELEEKKENMNVVEKEFNALAPEYEETGWLTGIGHMQMKYSHFVPILKKVISSTWAVVQAIFCVLASRINPIFEPWGLIFHPR